MGQQLSYICYQRKKFFRWLKLLPKDRLTSRLRKVCVYPCLCFWAVRCIPPPTPPHHPEPDSTPYIALKGCKSIMLPCSRYADKANFSGCCGRIAFCHGHVNFCSTAHLLPPSTGWSSPHHPNCHCLGSPFYCTAHGR